MDIRSSAATILKKHLAIDESLLEVPKDKALGDMAYPCFSHAKALKKAPQLIAKGVVESLTAQNQNKQKLYPFCRIEAVGPYINFFMDPAALGSDVLPIIAKKKLDYGRGMATPKNAPKKTLMVEYASPNTNKPLHLGHLRNLAIGHSVSSLLQFAGAKVIQSNINNDRGVHICKSMLAYQRWGKGEQPTIKTDHFVGKYYVVFNKKAEENKALEGDAQEMLRKWEAGDKETRKLWKLMNAWAYSGFEETYGKLGVSFDKYYYESDIYEDGKKIVLDGLKKGVFRKNDDGAVVADIPGHDPKVLLRADGTSVYMTQDLYLATLKFKEYQLDQSIHVVGSEQNYHFQVLFALFKMLKYPWAGKCSHLSYGMVYLPHGKMKSREGTVVDADDIIQNMADLAKVEIRKRHNDLSEEEVGKRAMVIGLAALKFFLLKIDPSRDMHFDPKESISFDGETGPYVQYAHARICSVLRKFRQEHAGKEQKSKPSSTAIIPSKTAIMPSKASRPSTAFKADASLLVLPAEAALIKLLHAFPDVVGEAAANYRPSALARYLLDLAQAFNEFYHACPILTEEQKLRDARLLLIDCVRVVLDRGLNLLGIQAPEEM
ncbi:arginine--tRNA ligase [Candidatus Woesearchaeota archaeon]|nr:arginine--tRNA ligase [Candidatus Woesearchaeota archaeon]